MVKYKNANPNENFLKTKCNLTYIYTATYSFSDVEVRFLLPENQTISVFYTAETLETGKQDVNIFDSNIKIPTSSGYKTLTKEDISSLTEQNSNYVEISNEFKVELNLVAIQNYFDTYESSYLKIELNLITQRGDSVAIDIYVKLNTAT